jgi:hypothetical protein
VLQNETIRNILARMAVVVTIGDCWVAIYGDDERLLRRSVLTIETDPTTGRIQRIGGIRGQANCSDIILSVVGFPNATAHIEFDSSHWEWEAYVVFSEPGPLCDSDVTLRAECVGHPECFDEQQFHLSCGDPTQTAECPTITGRVNPDNRCIQGRRPVFLTVDFEPPLTAGMSVSIGWAFGDSEDPPGSGSNAEIQEVSITEPTPSITNPYHPYASGGPYFASAFVTVDTGSVSCNAVPVSFPSFIAQPCPATGQCPTLTIDSLGPPPCATVGARVTAQASLEPVGTGTVEFTWSVKSPSGRRWQRHTTLPSMDTGTGVWQDATLLTDSVVRLDETGTYEIVVTAEVPNTPPECQPSDSVTFDLLACDENCPTVELQQPEVTGCGTGAKITLRAQTAPPAPAGTNFNWSVQLSGALRGQRTTTVPQASSEDTWTHTDGSVGPLRVQAGDMTASVSVVLPNQIETCPVPTDSVSFEVEACTNPPITHDGDPVDESRSDGCGILYWLGLIMLVAGSVVAFGGLCTANPVIIGIGVGAAVVGAFLLVLWALLCVRVAGCRALQRLIGFIHALIVLFGILGLILVIVAFILSQVGVPPINAGCIAGAFAVAGYLGVVSVILFNIFIAKRCDWEGDNPFN